MNIDFSQLLSAAARQDLEEARLRAGRRMDAEAFLRRTDWLVLRQAETGRPVPEEIRAGRAAARAEISALGDALSVSGPHAMPGA